MLWNHDHKLAICHTPRTGGTALREAFVVPDKGILQWQHSGYKHRPWKKLDRQTQDSIRDHTIICVHRHPYDRMISMYQHWILRPGRHTNFCEFKNWIKSTRYDLYPEEHRLPQSHYCEGLPEHTIYIPFTELGSAWNYLRNKVPETLQFWLKEKVNASIKFIEPSSALTSVAKQWINEHHSEDFSRFGYQKD